MIVCDNVIIVIDDYIIVGFYLCLWRVMFFLVIGFVKEKWVEEVVERVFVKVVGIRIKRLCFVNGVLWSLCGFDMYYGVGYWLCDMCKI